MKPAGITESLWLGRGDPIPAQERLRSVVAALTRACRLQRMVDHGFEGLLLGLALATGVVLAVRLVPLSYSPWEPAGAAVIVALAIALWTGWQRLPDALEVVIRADLKLELRQRLSTAWEFMTGHGDGELIERLAAQAVKAELPRSPGRVFPLRINRSGQLVPLAATALVLASVLDWGTTQAPVPRLLDERVMSEGQRLGAFARAMQARARRDALPRSASQADQLERLGARMEGGALSRAQTLEHLGHMGRSLDDEATQALADASESGADVSPGASRAKPGAPSQPSTMGTLRGEDTGALKERLDDPVRSSIPRAALEEDMKRQAADDEARGRMLEKAAPAERARREYEELQRARERVRQAQENLGESLSGRRNGGDNLAADIDKGENGEDDDGWDRSRDGRGGASVSSSAARRDVPVAGEPPPSPSRADSSQTGPVLKPQGQMREGEAFVSQAQIMPRSVQLSVENVEMRREFASQVEEVLSKEHYPTHYKTFVRQYFLTLSQGAPAAHPRSAETR